MPAKFLQGRSTVKAEEIVDLIYNHPDSVPKAAQSNASRPASAMLCPDKELMARWKIKEWAVRLVEKIVSKEAEVMASKEGGLHLSNEQSNWKFVHNFSFGKVMATVQGKAPTLLRVLTAAAVKPADDSVKEMPKWDSYAEHFSKPIPSGSENNKRDPFVVSMVVGTRICRLVELDILDCFYCLYDAVGCSSVAVSPANTVHSGNRTRIVKRVS